MIRLRLEEATQRKKGRFVSMSKRPFFRYSDLGSVLVLVVLPVLVDRRLDDRQDDGGNGQEEANHQGE